LIFAAGIVLFALCIGICLAIHEAAHLGTARMFGMKVRRYFIGFGPTIWSTRRGETEYGLKAIPAGGFCDIAGMTALDELSPDEHKRAMWRYPVWKRTVVMASGSISHFLLGFIILYLIAVVMGLPNSSESPVVRAVSPCAQSVATAGPNKVTYVPCKPGDPAPAKAAGVRAGDQIVSVNGKQTPTWEAVTTTLRPLRGPTPVVVDRDGQRTTLTVDVAKVRTVSGDSQRLIDAGALGVQKLLRFDYNPVTAVGGTVAFTGTIFVNVLEGITKLPEKLPALLSAIGGGARQQDTPISVVGASQIGGEVVEAGLWPFFFLLLALVNFGLGIFNLLPLLPLDGGHIAVSWYEKVRDWFRKLRGLAAGGPVDYTKLAPVTMVVVVIGGTYMVVAIIADIVNPIRLLE
jgi:membrane-associated protease RseP (regulator of RpoE activity)